ncbi:MAG: HEAT repeat domain-containing protein [Myxococcales bacterium]
MHDRTALRIWKTVALGALGACATLMLRAPSASAVLRKDAPPGDAVGSDAAASWFGERSGNGRSDLARLSAAVDHARSPESRCAALKRLARSPSVDSVAVDHIASYAEPEHMIDVRMCATIALGDTQAEDAIAPLTALIDDSFSGIAEVALTALMQFEATSARDAVIDAARSGPEHIRIAALRALAVEGDARAFALIMEGIENANPNLRDQLLNILGSTHDPRAVSLLSGYVQSGPRRLQYVAINALGELGGARAEAVLIGVVRDDPSLAAVACQSLARSDSEDASEVLLEAAQGDYGPQVAMSALQALAQRETPAITALMTSALGSANTNQVTMAVEYFGNHGIDSAVPALAELAKRGGPFTWNVVHALGRIGGDTARRTIEELASGSNQAGQAALQVLSGMPGGMDVARRMALAQLKAGPGARGQQLIELIGGDDSPEAQAALLVAARGSDPQLSQQALNWLGQRKDPENIAVLQELARSGGTPTQRASALGALVQSGDPSAHEYLQRALKDESPEVRAHAVGAFLEGGHSDTEAVLLDATRDSDANVAIQATYALSNLASPKALSRIEEMARAGNDVSGQALQVLANADPNRARPIAEALAQGNNSQARLAAVQIVGMLPPESSKQILISAVRSADSMSLREALGQLGNLGLPQAELKPLLEPLTQNKELPEDVAQLAAQLLGGS